MGACVIAMQFPCIARASARAPAGARPGRAHRCRAARGDARAPGIAGLPRARPRARAARAVRRHRRACSPPERARSARSPGSARRARRSFAAMVEFVRRALARGSCRSAMRSTSPDAVRDYLRLTLARAALRSLRRPVPRQPEPADRRARALPRHACADQRLPAGSGQGGARAQCGGGHLRAQPSKRRRRALARGRAADRVAQAGARAGRHPDARPPRRRRTRGWSRSPSAAL